MPSLVPEIRPETKRVATGVACSVWSKRLSLVVLCGSLASTYACGDDDGPATVPMDDASVPADAGSDTGTAASTDAGTTDPRIEHAVAAIRTALESAEVPGAAVAIVEEGRDPFFAGIGVRDLDEVGAIGPHTVFRVASLSKLVTVAVILSLAEDGLLSLDDRVVDRLPAFRVAESFDPSAITVRHLLTHTSGLPDIAPLICPESSASEWVASRTDMTLWAPAGEVWDYSNTGYTVAAAVAETVSGQSFTDLAEERVFLPLGMSDTTYDAALAADRDHASGHGIEGSISVLGIADYTCPALDGSAGLITSATDYARFLVGLFGSDAALLERASVAELTESAVSQHVVPWERYGLGLDITDDPELGVEVLAHDGELPGYRAGFLVVPSEQRMVVLLTNGNPFDWWAPLRRAMAALREIPLEPYPSVEPSAEALARTAGRYVDPFGQLGEVTIEVRSDSLWARIAGTSFEGILGQRAGRFAAGDLQIVFAPNDGPAEWVVTRIGVARRVE